jgi:predicted transcriptional regulator
MAHELNDADAAILSVLLDGRSDDRPWGRELPKNISSKLDYSRQYVQNRLQILSAAGLVRNIGGGLYEVTGDGVDRVTESEE